MRKYPRNVEEKDNYLSLLIFPNLMLYIIAFAGFDYFYNNVFCEFKAELHLTKILYFLMIVICSYNASKLILTLVEFPYRTYKGEHYTYRNKFNFFKAIYKKQFFRIFIMCFFSRKHPRKTSLLCGKRLPGRVASLIFKPGLLVLSLPPPSHPQRCPAPPEAR